jgi:hypothetical protein
MMDSGDAVDDAIAGLLTVFGGLASPKFLCLAFGAEVGPGGGLALFSGVGEFWKFC